MIPKLRRPAPPLSLPFARWLNWLSLCMSSNDSTQNSAAKFKLSSCNHASGLIDPQANWYA